MQARNIVKGNLLLGTKVYIDSSQWLEWLATNNAFRYSLTESSQLPIPRCNFIWILNEYPKKTTGDPDCIASDPLNHSL